jgi:hypothetical protein
MTKKNKEKTVVKSKRLYRKSIYFNKDEMKVIEFFLKKNKLENMSKFFRESIISEILRKSEENYPTLF